MTKSRWHILKVVAKEPPTSETRSDVLHSTRLFKEDLFRRSEMQKYRDMQLRELSHHASVKRWLYLTSTFLHGPTSAWTFQTRATMSIPIITSYPKKSQQTQKPHKKKLVCISSDWITISFEEIRSWRNNPSRGRRSYASAYQSLHQ